MTEYLLLKWGTLKGFDVTGNEKAKEAVRRYHEAGEVQFSVMTQHDNPAQKQALCDLIDAVNGDIQNDWSGDHLTKDEAKKYVLEYGRKA